MWTGQNSFEGSRVSNERHERMLGYKAGEAGEAFYRRGNIMIYTHCL